MSEPIHYREARFNTSDTVYIGDDLMHDNRLSYTARGLFGFMATATDMDEVRRHSPESPQALETALVELERYGYLLRHTDDATGGTVYNLTSSPGYTGGAQ